LPFSTSFDYGLSTARLGTSLIGAVRHWACLKPRSPNVSA
jgi:hypothetical protein